MSASLTKRQVNFLRLLDRKPAPVQFGWYQPERPNSALRGALVQAYGPPSGWTHFLAACRDGEHACVSRAEWDGMNEAGLVAHCQITNDGRNALIVAELDRAGL